MRTCMMEPSLRRLISRTSGALHFFTKDSIADTLLRSASSCSSPSGLFLHRSAGGPEAGWRPKAYLSLYRAATSAKRSRSGSSSGGRSARMVTSSDVRKVGVVFVDRGSWRMRLKKERILCFWFSSRRTHHGRGKGG